MLNPEDPATQETAENERRASPHAFSYKPTHLTVDAVAVSTFWGCRGEVVDRKCCGVYLLTGRTQPC